MNTCSYRSRVLITDDDPDIRSTLSTLMRCEGFEPLEAEDGQAAVRIVREGLADLLLLDQNMPGISGVEVLKLVRKLDADLPVIMLTGFGTNDMAVEAGAHAVKGILTKPFRNDDVMLGVRMALAGQRHARKKAGAKRLLSGLSLREVMGPSVAIQDVVTRIERVAPSDFTVIISGETGVGKEVVAQATHGLSRRASGPFMAVDCGAIPASLIESELFGHEKGAFTGADRLRVGCFEAAAGGTLFFDEIGNLPLAMQAKLLRALQERQIHRIGGTVPIDLDVRVIAATNESLDASVHAGTFRRDLFYRLNEFGLLIPPLRQRPEDILFLAKRFLDWTREELRREVCVMTNEAVETLLLHSWPGNIRELRNVVRRAVLLAETSIGPEHLQLADMSVSAGSPEALSTLASPREESFKGLMQENTAEVEKAVLLRYLTQTHGNLKEAARILKMDYKTIRTKAKQYQLLPLA
jgi:two-component system nitrogen regulation response regulator GlnG